MLPAVELSAARVEPQHLADHPLLFAIPVLVPTFVVVAVIVGVVVRDRRRHGSGDDDDEA
jgi:hypothetical protein